MSFTRQQLAEECQSTGPQLALLPTNIDGARFLWALAGNESSYGVNCTPRHEPAFDVGGTYGDGAVMKPLLAKYGKAAACSYGPWQQMFCNAPEGFAPDSYSDLHKCALAAVAQINKALRKWQPLNLASIGECWNAGRPLTNPSVGVARVRRGTGQELRHDASVGEGIVMERDLRLK